MKASRLLVTALLIMLCVGFSSCSKDDSSEQDTHLSAEQYATLLYGSWYRESSSELSKFFIKYTFSSNMTLVRYTKSAGRSKSEYQGITSYSDWGDYRETSLSGTWYIDFRYERFYHLMIQWDGNDQPFGNRISYLDSNILNFDNDLYKGDKSPDF